MSRQLTDHQYEVLAGLLAAALLAGCLIGLCGCSAEAQLYPEPVCEMCGQVMDGTDDHDCIGYEQ